MAIDILKDRSKYGGKQFYNKRGLLTSYALSCGCIEHSFIPGRRYTGKYLRISREHGTYNVCLVDRTCGNEQRVYECFRTLTEARKLFFKLQKEHKLVRQ